jgi:hypothetical protein
MSLKELIPLCVINFIEELHNKYNLDETELYKIWDDISQIKLQKNKVEKTEKLEKVENNKEEKNNNKTCVYIMKSGKNSGEACGCKLSDKSKLELFCNRHIKEEEKVLKARNISNSNSSDVSEEKEQEKSITKTKTISKKINKDIPTMKPELVKLIEKQRQKISVVKNKFGNYEHNETHLVIEPTEKIVIGKQSDDGRVLELTSEDISICKLYNLKFKIPNNIISSSENKQTLNQLIDDDEEDISDEEEDISDEN